MEKMAHFLSLKTSGKTWLSKELLGLILILLLGFFLRIYKIKDYITFLGDEGRDVLVVYNILHGDLTLLGPTSSVGGFFLGPVYYYLMTPFLWLFRYDPVGPAIMVVLFGLATIYLVYRMGKEFFGLKASLIASFLYAISPVVVIYSRSSWNPNVFPFFTIASFYALYKGVSKNNPILFVLAGILMGINLQVHYLATFAGAIMFFYVFLVISNHKLSGLIELLKRYALMFLGFVIGFSPFLLFEIRHGFPNTTNILRFIFCSGETNLKFPFCTENVPLIATGPTVDFATHVNQVFMRLFGGLILALPNSDKFWKYNDHVVNLWHILSLLLGLIAVGFFIYMFVKKRPDKKEYQKYLLIFLWGLLGIGLFGFYKKSIYDYYLGFLFPLPFLLIGFLFSTIAEKLKIYGVILIGAVLIALAYIHITHNPINVPGNQQVNQMKTIADFVVSKTNGEPFNFGLITGGNSDHAYRYFLKLAKRDPVVILNPDVDPERKSVTNQLFVVCETLPCAPEGHSLWEIAGFGRAQITDEWEVSVVKIYRLEHYEGE